ncbi:hypothetical protein KR009_000877 [Drosophila setifemur]|nr:hypothetical protein KR009_000877 [Drosophila setifemur]
MADQPQNTSKNEDEKEHNAATDFGLEDHVANRNDPRVNTLMESDKRRASSTKASLINPNHQSHSPGGTHQLAHSRSGTDRIQLTSSRSGIHRDQIAPSRSGNDRDQPAKSSIENAATGFGMEDHKANAQDPRVVNLQDEHRRDPNRPSTPLPIAVPTKPVRHSDGESSGPESDKKNDPNFKPSPPPQLQSKTPPEAPPQPKSQTAALSEAQPAPPEPKAQPAPERKPQTAAPESQPQAAALPEPKAQRTSFESKAQPAAPEPQPQAAALPEPKAQPAPPEPKAQPAVPEHHPRPASSLEPKAQGPVPPEPQPRTAAPREAMPQPEASPGPQPQAAAPNVSQPQTTASPKPQTLAAPSPLPRPILESAPQSNFQQSSGQATPPGTPETPRKSIEFSEPLYQPQRPEDVPLPPPVMGTSFLMADTKAVQDDEDQNDLQNALSKVTNTDVTFDPSKDYATKATNTSPDSSGVIYTDSGDDEEDEREAESKIPEQVSADDLDNLFLLARREVRKVGDMAQSENMKSQDSSKNVAQDPVTPVDNIVETQFIEAISSRYPDHKFIAEVQIQNSETGVCDLTDAPTWIIDPIDGTTNFAHRFPYYCISVAYLVNKKIEFGIIYNPPMKNMYSAQRDKGAKMNGRQIYSTDQKDLSTAMVLQDYNEDSSKAKAVSMKNAEKLSNKCQALRSIGSTAMCLAMVASGAADGFYNFGLHVWDMAAGVIIITEAGGIVMDPAGGELDIMSRRCLAASTEPLAKELGSNLEQNYPKPRDDEPRPEKMDAVPGPEMADFTSQTDFPDSDDSMDSDLNQTQVQMA